MADAKIEAHTESIPLLIYASRYGYNGQKRPALAHHYQPACSDQYINFFLAHASITAIMSTSGNAHKYEGIDAAAVRRVHTSMYRGYSASESGNPCRCSERLGEIVGSPDIVQAGVAKQ